jgi:glycosyltransferase involved in cell wall biosynthesis
MIETIHRHRRLRVAHVTLGLEMGGQEKLLVELARHADRSRFDLYFISLSTRGLLAADLEACGWSVTALEEPAGLRPGMVLRLAKLFRRLKTDVVHTHDDRPLIYGASAGRVARVPAVIHTRHGRSVYLSRRQGFLVRAAAALADRFVCVSEDSADLSRRQGLAAGRVVTIPNGIDVGRFAYSGPRAGGPVVTVARLTPEKDIACLVRAAEIAGRTDTSFAVEIAGDGPCLESCRQLARDLGVEPRVRFLGRVQDVAGLLARASLFAMSSLSEGIPLALLEAMARGLPVAATNVGGIHEVVVEGETGLLVPSGDPVSLARSMLRLHKSPAEAQQMGLKGRQRVERDFDVRRMVARYEDLYIQPAPTRRERAKRAGRAIDPAGVAACATGMS